MELAIRSAQEELQFIARKERQILELKKELAQEELNLNGNYST
jgi:hypothetical protein